MKKSAKRTVRTSAKATRQLVKQLGGRLTPASGAFLEKGDGRVVGKYRIETKCPPTGKYRVTYTEWFKIWTAAVRANETPVFHLKFGGQDIILIREVDYLGFGGTETRVCELNPHNDSHTIDFHTWISLQVLSRHWTLHVSNGTKKVQLRMMPFTDFLALSEAQP